MDPEFTVVEFFDSTTFNTLTTSDSWNVAHTILTCTPTPAFPSNRLIVWSASGLTPDGDPLGGEGGGAFTTGGGGSTGSGTNRVTLFTIGKTHAYVQTSTATPDIDSVAPYSFSAQTSLASNRTANSVRLTLPGGGIVSLMQFPGKPEQFIYLTNTLTQSALDTGFPNGNYIFNVQAPTSNQQMTVNFPASPAQPPVPHLSDYAAAQAVDAAQPFMLRWDPLPGGTASDYIFVQIGSAFRTPDPGSTGALNGTATAVVVPAGTLQSNMTYEGTLGFYRASINAVGTSHVTTAYRATLTQFPLITSGPPGAALILTNSAWNGFFFSFAVLAAPGQRFTVDSAPAANGPWQLLLLTNAPPSGRVEILDVNSFSVPSSFYRARNTP